MTTLFLSSLSLTGCASVNQLNSPLSLNKDKNGITQSEAYVASFPEVTIEDVALKVNRDVFKVGDTANVKVYDVDNLSAPYIVDRFGDVNFPLIGSVKVAGMTTVDLQQALTEKYGSKYLQNPNINVQIEAQDLGRVVVDGAVNKPGVFDINRIIRLSEAVALAGGLDEDANGSSIYIVRTIDGQRQVTEANLKDIRKLGSPDPQIIPDDVIFVQDSAGRVLFREFLRTLPILNSAVILSRL